MTSGSLLDRGREHSEYAEGLQIRRIFFNLKEGLITHKVRENLKKSFKWTATLKVCNIIQRM